MPTPAVFSRMSHTPERVERYVCENCQSIYAGTVRRSAEGEGHRYDPPAECAACGGDSFVTIESYPHTG